MNEDLEAKVEARIREAQSKDILGKGIVIAIYGGLSKVNGFEEVRIHHKSSRSSGDDLYIRYKHKDVFHGSRGNSSNWVIKYIPGPWEDILEEAYVHACAAYRKTLEYSDEFKTEQEKSERNLKERYGL